LLFKYIWIPFYWTYKVHCNNYGQRQWGSREIMSSKHQAYKTQR